MRNFLLLLAFVIFFTCKEKEETPPVVVTPDYADSVVGTYYGTEVRKSSDNYTIQFSSSTKTMTVTKLEKNKVHVQSFDLGYSPKFTLSESSNGVKFTPESYTSTGSNNYTLSTKYLNLEFTNGGTGPRYFYYQATKQ
jgi:hypothetical protein